MTPILVVMGPTASGKSRLGLECATRLEGEIISADAFAVYRGLDIGTDKPDARDRAAVPHHLVDILDPRERYSAGEFAHHAGDCIRAVRARGRTAVVVGGTHFYLRALLEGLFPGPPTDLQLRRQLEEAWQCDPEALVTRLTEVDPDAARVIGRRDRQRILRALEVFETTGQPISSHWRRHRKSHEYRPLLVAPTRSREELYARIDSRVDSMFEQGLVREVHSLLERGVPAHAHAFKAIGYREVVDMLITGEELGRTIASVKHASRQFAKRQLSWLRRQTGNSLHWVPPAELGGGDHIHHLWHEHIGRSQPS